MESNKKYELTAETKVFFGKTLYRIRALVTFGDVPAGQLGGWVESEKNLSHSGNAWITGNALVMDNALVTDNAWVMNNASVTDNAWIAGNAWIMDNASVTNNASVTGKAMVTGDARVSKSTHLLCVGGIGSRNGFTTFARSKDKKIIVACGCFRGTIDEFVDRVKQVHGGTKHEKTYLAAVELAKLQIDDVEVEE